MYPLKKKSDKLSDVEIVAIPAEFAQDIAKRIRDAAEMGDVMTLNAIAEEIKDALRFLCTAQQTDCSNGGRL